MAEVINRQVQALHSEETLEAALKELTTRHVSRAPVVESGNQRVVGILTLSQIVHAYQQVKAKTRT